MLGVQWGSPCPPIIFTPRWLQLIPAAQPGQCLTPVPSAVGSGGHPAGAPWQVLCSVSCSPEAGLVLGGQWEVLRGWVVVPCCGRVCLAPSGAQLPCGCALVLRAAWHWGPCLCFLSEPPGPCTEPCPCCPQCPWCPPRVAELWGLQEPLCCLGLRCCSLCPGLCHRTWVPAVAQGGAGTLLASLLLQLPLCP